MPPTRRHESRGLVKRKLTRRRSRGSTWIDMLAVHNAKASLSTGLSTLTNSTSKRATPNTATGSSCFEAGVMRGHAPSDTPARSDHLSSSRQFGEEPTIAQDHHFDQDYLLESDDELPTHDDIEAAAEEFESFSKGRLPLLRPANLIALTMLSGTVKFSVKQYEIVRALLNFASDSFQLTSYSTIQRKIFPLLMQNCFPRSIVVKFPSQAPWNAGEGGRLKRQSCLSRIVLPTEWAKLDVATLPYFENIYGDRERERVDPCANIEDSRIVRDRDSVINISRYLFVEDKYGKTPAYAGDSISFKVVSIPSGITYDELARQGFCINQSGHNSFSATIIATWCVGSPSLETESGKDALLQSPVRFRPVIRAMVRGSVLEGKTSAELQGHRRRAVQIFFTFQQVPNSKVVPGDFCSLLPPSMGLSDSSDEPNVCCVIVSRCLKQYEGMPSQFVMGVRVNVNNGGEAPFSVLDVQQMPSFQALISKGHQLLGRHNPRNNGKLLDGRRYVIYRVLLYCDDFKSSGSAYSQSSCGGVYLLPIGMTQIARRFRNAVHVISLTPAGVSTNEILLKIIPDLVKGSTGIEGVLPSGEPVVIFIDFVGFIADYPAAAEPLDVLGHTVDTPCSHCSIRKSKNNGSSSMGFTTNVHASFSPSLRCAERHNALRESILTNRETNHLGMKQQEVSATKEYPLSKFRDQLLASRHLIPATSDNAPVLNGLFDPFRSSLVTPDHLLSGLARNIIDLSFRVLSPEQRKVIDIAICSALQDNALLQQRTVYNEKKIQLHTMSLSSLFCVLLVFHPVCQGLLLPEDNIILDIFQLLNELKDLIAMTYWSPSIDVDGKKAYALMTAEDGRPYQSFLQGLAERYVMRMNAFCSAHPEIGSVLDKPNLHRLLELYHHTIPAFGHVSLFQELVFETAHQPLKRSVGRGNHKDAETSAIEQCLGNDWQARLGMLQDSLGSNDVHERRYAYNGLFPLLMGRDAIAFTKSNAVGSLEKAVDECFITPLLKAIQSNGSINQGLIEGKMHWKTECEGPPTGTNDITQHTILVNLMESARIILHAHNGSFGERADHIKLRWKAKMMKESTSVGRTAVASMNEILAPGTVFQAVLKTTDESSRIVRPHSDEDCAVGIFVVIGFLHAGVGGQWVAGVRCRRTGKDAIKIPKKMGINHIQLLRMGEGIRRVAVYHMCRYGVTCKIDNSRRTVRHNETTLTGGSFRTQTRSQGYPPRLA